MGTTDDKEPDYKWGKRRSVHDRPLTKEEKAEADREKDVVVGGDYFEGWGDGGSEYS